MNAVANIDRKEQILLAALEIIATKGFGKLTMRELARASGLKLGALQYHYATWEELLRSLAGYVSAEYTNSVESLERELEDASITDVVRWYLQDSGGEKLRSELLWPQLWAMARVEPVMRESLDEIFTKVVARFERHLAHAGSTAPRLEALALLSFGEGSLLFTGPGCPWEEEGASLTEAMLEFIEARYPTRQES